VGVGLVTNLPNVGEEVWATGDYAWLPGGGVTPVALATTAVVADPDAVGGCCRTGPAHVAAMWTAVDGRWPGGANCRWAAAGADEAGAR